MKREFHVFERIDRSDKFIVCRTAVNYDCFSDRDTLFYKFATDRNVYSTGDIRVSFYQATCPEPVQFLAQQVPSAEYEG